MAEYIERELAIEALSRGEGCGNVCRRAIERILAADVAPVRHGHWNTGYFHDRVCSCCLHPDNDINDYAHSYCPNCGAKMDGGA